MKPILFNTEMVRAIVDGRKTVTRRCINVPNDHEPAGYTTINGKKKVIFCLQDHLVLADGKPRVIGMDKVPYSPVPFEKGDILYVRETWTKSGLYTDIDERGYLQTCLDQDEEDQIIIHKEVAIREGFGGIEETAWKPAIHMKKEDARLFLEVTNVDIQKLHQITAMDCVREGIIAPAWTPDERIDTQAIVFSDFERLWDSTVKYECQTVRHNPWVWVIDFKVIERDEAWTKNSTSGK